MQSESAIPYSLYIHVPFCRQACSYCDFYFVTRKELIPSFTEALLDDIRTSAEHYRSALLSPETSSHARPALQSVYFGGGTPSRLPADSIARILDTIHATHGLDDVKEITLEANPDDLTSLGQVTALRQAGVTRLSMGIQSFDPALLAFMHRAHTAGEASRSLGFIQDAGFPSHTVDLIYGNPGQTLAQLEADIHQFLAWNPPHLSAYALTIEPGTRLGKARDLGRLTEPEDQDVARHMDLVITMLADAGLNRYEVSNFARSGHEAVHNSSYWNHIPYLGLGPGAHSLTLVTRPDGRITSASRWSEAPDLQNYLHAEPGNRIGTDKEVLTDEALAEERLLMGLRTREGVTDCELLKRYAYTFDLTQRERIHKLEKEGYLTYTNGRLVLRTAGFTLADRLTLEILSSRDAS